MNNNSSICFQGQVEDILSIQFRVVQIVQIFLSIVGSILTSYFLIKLLPTFPAHRNIKILLLGYFLSVLLSSLVFIVDQSYECYLSLTYVSSCDIGLSPTLHYLVISTVAFCLILQATFQFCLVIERSVATSHADTYESYDGKISTLLSVATVFLAVLYVWQALPPSLFNEPVICGIVVPKSSAVVVTFSIGLITGFSALIIMFIIARVNKVRETRDTSSLTGKYQRVENIRATYFVVFVVGAHSCLQLVYTITQVILNIATFMSPDTKFFVAYLSYMNPLTSVILPLVAIHQLRRLRNQRVRRKEKAVEITGLGESAGEHYHRILKNQWQ